MWPFDKSTEILISSNNEQGYLDDFRLFLERHFDAKYIQHSNVSFDMDCYEFKINNQNLTIFCEGMSGTSLIGKRKLVEEIIQKAKTHVPEMIE